MRPHERVVAPNTSPVAWALGTNQRGWYGATKLAEGVALPPGTGLYVHGRWAQMLAVVGVDATKPVAWTFGRAGNCAFGQMKLADNVCLPAGTPLHVRGENGEWSEPLVIRASGAPVLRKP